MVARGIALPGQPRGADPPGRPRRLAEVGLPDEAVVCSCNNVTKAADRRRGRRRRQLRQRLVRHGLHPGRQHLRLLQAGGEEDRRGVLRVQSASIVDRSLCEHFPLTRQELFDVVAVHGYTRFDEIVAAHGTGRGCDICKPAIASILASQLNGHVLEGTTRTLQDTNDAYLANIQRNGTYSRRPAHPRRRDHAREADRDRRGRPRLRALHQDHRRPADRPVRRPDGGAAGDLAAAGRRRLRVRARLRQGAAHGEVLRRLDLVPVRRPGLGAARHRPRAALPRAALAAQAQGRRQRLRPRVRRGAVQGLRGDRHREGLEPLRRRQRRRDPGARAAAGRRPRHRDAGPLPRPVPHVLHPHRRPAAAHRALGRVARRRPRPGPRGGRRRRARPRRRAGGGDGAARRRRTSTSGGRPSRTPRSWRRFVSFVNAPDTPDPHITFRDERDQRMPAESEGPVLLGDDDPGGRRRR